MLIRPVTVAELLTPAGRALFVRHHAEIVAEHGPEYPLQIDEQTLRVTEALGMWLGLGLFTDGGELVGYAVGTVASHPLSAARTVVVSRALYVAVEHRKFGNGRNLIDAFEAASGLRDAHVHWVAHAGTTFERILERRGARKVETVYLAKPR